jgi:hypothetical protein
MTGSGCTTADCAYGSSGCPCDSLGTCDDGLLCDRGYCVADACPPGTEDCRCHDNGSCNPLDGTPMTCAGGICVETSLPSPGALGGSCRDGAPRCDDDGTWGQLLCNAGRCEAAGCPSGDVGCPCGAYGSCDDFDGRPVRCNEGVCVLGTCIQDGDGTLGCNCREGAQCDGDLLCLRGTCRSDPVLTLKIATPAARACDVLIQIPPDTSLNRVVFTESVVGRHLQRGRKVALAFFHREDMAFDGDLLTVELASTNELAPTAASILSAECADRLGNPISNPIVQLD